MHLPKLRQIRNKEISKRNQIRSTKCKYVLKTERNKRQKLGLGCLWPNAQIRGFNSDWLRNRTPGSRSSRQQSELWGNLHPQCKHAMHPTQIDPISCFWVQRVATQPLRVGGPEGPLAEGLRGHWGLWGVIPRSFLDGNYEWLVIERKNEACPNWVPTLKQFALSPRREIL